MKQAHIPYILARHLEIDADPDPAYHFDADQAYHFDADPDPTFQFDADPCGSTTMLTRCRNIIYKNI